MEILKKPYKKAVNAKKYSAAKWPHERAAIARKKVSDKKKPFVRKDYNKERAARLKEFKEWF